MKKLPGFTAEASIYCKDRIYAVVAKTYLEESIQPASNLRDCIRWCGDDELCVECCVCVARGEARIAAAFNGVRIPCTDF
jgi:hypothetical protein